MQNPEEEKENLDCCAQTEPGLWQDFHQQQQHQQEQQQYNVPLQATENTEDAAAALWWSSSAGARRSDIPPASASASMLPRHLLLNPRDAMTTGRPNSSSSQLGNITGFLTQPLNSLQSNYDRNDVKTIS